MRSTPCSELPHISRSTSIRPLSASRCSVPSTPSAVKFALSFSVSKNQRWPEGSQEIALQLVRTGPSYARARSKIGALSHMFPLVMLHANERNHRSLAAMERPFGVPEPGSAAPDNGIHARSDDALRGNHHDLAAYFPVSCGVVISLLPLFAISSRVSRPHVRLSSSRTWKRSRPSPSLSSSTTSPS
jgi:hypothetical protein